MASGKKVLNPFEILQKKQEAERLAFLKSNAVRLADYLEKQTTIWAKKWKFGYKEAEKKLSDKAQAAQKFIQTGTPFGCNTKAVQNLISIVLGENIVSSSTIKVDFDVEDIVLVPLHVDNGHNYALNKPCLFTSHAGGRNFFSIKQQEDGNDLTQSKDCLRPATRKEIESLIPCILKQKDSDWIEQLFTDALK